MYYVLAKLMILTTLERDVALVKEFRYRDAKVSVTGSSISMVTASSSLSTLLVWASLMLAV
jgi:hypothetical protein